ncbi:hypothetical protein BDV32DRAFT_61776 [Aspergillus pseudonomiae]|uniref:Uncharacterized protein n=1 Tax=Aspergillus pseudonomiae TaxID=1506151 RepID=A0A5N7DM03_9EURO|nr:uncharacterized protein BDV37DRAFT_18976 [Aspergillus pseudonomiae]KAB8264868.1 hypothetical protein BDV32DRAFT_61776 [Aspergillus pseudonomiae]KAE8407476.1 hypothetical protein BDV37DRAFT_18976 [Aspergillus pseudonomiae]
MQKRKQYLGAEDFYKGKRSAPFRIQWKCLSPNPIPGLRLLDSKLAAIPIIVAFAPIKVIAAGGFFAVAHLKNRQTTKDLDYLLEPDWANDNDIKQSLREAIVQVADELGYPQNWANDDVALFVTKQARHLLMSLALKQNIVLWSGNQITVLSAPVEWALERKLRRIYAADRGRKAELDLSDALAMLNLLKNDKGGKLDMEYYRTLNINGFDVVPDHETMQRVSAAYKAKYNEEIFF